MYEANTGHTEQFINSPQVDDEYGFLIAFPANYGVGSYPVVIALHDRGTHLTANLELRNMALVLNGVITDKIHIFGCNWLQLAATGWSQR